MMPTRRLFWSGDQGLSLFLFFLVIVLFVVVPLGNLDVVGQLLVSVSFTLILLSGVSAVARGYVTTAFVGGVVVVSLAVRWTRIVAGRPELEPWDVLLTLASCVILTLVVTYQVFRAGPINAYRIQGAVAVYLLLGLIFALAYEWLELRSPGSFAFPSPLTDASGETDRSQHFLYFSFTALTTVGFGDITPMHPFARSLASLEALVGQLYPAVLLARLVSLDLYYASRPPGPKRGGEG